MITLSTAQYDALLSLMAEDLSDNKTDYVARLIGDEVRRRRERATV
jgi:hypothetical protein